MNQIHLEIVDFFMNGDSKWLHIEKFSHGWETGTNEVYQNFTEQMF